MAAAAAARPAGGFLGALGLCLALNAVAVLVGGLVVAAASM